MYNEVNESTNIKVVGLGGGGGNAINRMIDDGISNVDFIAMNTDAQVLKHSKAPTVIQIGSKITKGRGAGADPKVGQRSAEESADEIKDALKNTQMVFLAAGMGGGTGTGSIPVVAKIAKELGILTVGIVTKPFNFEGKRKMRVAEDGIDELLQNVDSLIVVPNERLKLANLGKEKITLANAFAAADSVLQHGIMSISSLINESSFINLDFADVRAIMKDAGYAHMGMGYASGPDKAIEAANMALHSPLIETSIDDATGVVLNITASPDIELEEVEKAAEHITENVNPDANIIWGVTFNSALEDTINITLVATGFPGGQKPEAPAEGPAMPKAVFAADVKKKPEPKQTVKEPVAPDFDSIFKKAGLDEEDDLAPIVPPSTRKAQGTTYNSGYDTSKSKQEAAIDRMASSPTAVFSTDEGMQEFQDFFTRKPRRN